MSLERGEGFPYWEDRRYFYGAGTREIVMLDVCGGTKGGIEHSRLFLDCCGGVETLVLCTYGMCFDLCIAWSCSRVSRFLTREARDLHYRESATKQCCTTNEITSFV